ncbi:MAG: hypothetical protein H7Y09_03180 [Chitinophagaceae bacterium]|nr:hypothetical protein [Anaerolineae bacterium]
MRRKRLSVFVFSLLAALYAFPAVACDIFMAPLPTIRVAYDPFSPQDIVAPFSIPITNRSSEPCSVELHMSDQKGRGLLGKSLTYELKDDNGGSVNFGSETRDLITLLVLAPGETRSARLSILGLRGQLAAPGFYSGEIEVRVLDRDGNPAALAHQTLNLTFEVRPQLSVNIAGGGTKTTLDFQMLAPGQTRSVFVQTRSNLDYSLEATSKNRGSLALEPSVGTESWTIPYTLSCDGERVDLKSAVTACSNNSSGAGYGQHQISIEIGTFKDNRAGLYRDFITLEIKPRF